MRRGKAHGGARVTTSRASASPQIKDWNFFHTFVIRFAATKKFLYIYIFFFSLIIIHTHISFVRLDPETVDVFSCLLFYRKVDTQRAERWPIYAGSYAFSAHILGRFEWITRQLLSCSIQLDSMFCIVAVVVASLLFLLRFHGESIITKRVLNLWFSSAFLSLVKRFKTVGR